MNTTPSLIQYGTRTGIADLQTASRTTLEWWTSHHMLDGLAQQHLLDAHEQILVTAAELGIYAVQTLHARAREVLTAASNNTNITRFSGPAASDRLHNLRNAIAAMVLASEVLFGTDPRPYDLIASLPPVAPRSGSKRRPATDDEILLTRSAAIHYMDLSAKHQRIAMQHALAESGARPMETTSITPRDFDDPLNPSTVRLPGVNKRSQPRVVVLGRWSAHVLKRGLDDHLALTTNAVYQPIAFTGRSGTGSASAASGNNLKHCLERVGVTTPSLEGTAITRWRMKKELDEHGPVAALKLMGQFNPRRIDVQRVYDFLDQSAPIIVLPPQPGPRRSFRGM